MNEKECRHCGQSVFADDLLRKWFFLQSGIAECRRSFRFRTVCPDSKTALAVWRESAFLSYSADFL